MKTPPFLALPIVLLLQTFPHSLRAEPVDPALILTTVRTALASRGPLAERVRVSIKPLGKPARSDEFLLKVDPGKKPDHADAAAWLELGELRIHAAGGELVAVHVGDMTSCYAVQYGGVLRADTLRKLLPPIPAPLLSLILDTEPGEPANVSTDLTPYTPRITWERADAAGAPGAETVTLFGTRDPFPGERPEPEDTRVALTIDANSSRPTRFVALLPDAAELRLDFSPTVPGNPSTWAIRTDTRSKVASLTDLQARRGDAAVANTVPDLNLIDAEWKSWEYGSVFRAPAGAAVPAPTHLAIVFVRESLKDAFGVPSADVKVVEEELRRLAAELGVKGANDAAPGAAPATRLVHQVVPVMLTMDDTSRRKVENAVKLRAGLEGGVPGGAEGGGGGGGSGGAPIVWAASPERTIERFAPGAAAVCVVIRADNSLAGIILLDGRSRDAVGIRADLRRVLGVANASEVPGR